MNKCTLLIDFNWLTISRVSVMLNKFDKRHPEIFLQASKNDLKDMIAKSISIMLNRFPCIDNMVIAADGGSWRKNLPVPNSLKGITYKGNRSQDVEYAWNYIFEASEELMDSCKDLGITCTQYNNVEGDDWIWYWSRRLNASGVNCIIWSVDNDLKQLVQRNNDTGAFTVWYNDKNGLYIDNCFNNSCIDDIDFFMSPIINSPVLESIKLYNKKTVSYIHPDDIILSKIICGDDGDNIKSVFRYTKNNRVYRITEKDWDSISKDINIGTIGDLLNNIEHIAEEISNHKKYKPYKPNRADIEEMIRYNIRLVWLNENTLPQTLISVMNQQVYNEYDISYIKSNYKAMVGDDDYVKKIFEDCPF